MNTACNHTQRIHECIGKQVVQRHAYKLNEYANALENGMFGSIHAATQGEYTNEPEKNNVNAAHDIPRLNRVNTHPHHHVPPTLRTYGLEAGKFGCILALKKQTLSVRPCAPLSPDATTTVVPSRPTFWNSMFVRLTYAALDSPPVHCPLATPGGETVS